MKYYLYISDSKVNMLWPQKPRGFWGRISASLKFDLKVLGLSLEKKHFDETIHSKLIEVEEYIYNNFEVGTIDQPRSYFTGTLPMFTRILNKEPIIRTQDYVKGKRELAYFGGKTSQRYITLVGSSKHLIGTPKEVDEVQLSNVFGVYYPLAIVDVLKKAVSGKRRLKAKQHTPNRFSHFIESIYDNSKSVPQQRVQFLAKRLSEGEDFLLGTPLYVALAE